MSAIRPFKSSLPRNWLSGLTLANNATDAVNDVNIAVGACSDDGNAADIVLAGALTKRLDATWVAGTNQGGRDTGAIVDGSWHVFAIRNPTTGVVDVLFSLQIAAPTMPSGFTQKRRIGSIRRTTGTIIQFRQLGDYFQIYTPTPDVNNLGMTASQSTPAGLTPVPTGLKILAHISYYIVNNTGSANFQIKDPDQNTSALTITPQIANIGLAGTMQVWTNSAIAITLYFSGGGGTTTVTVYTLGYWDHRGKED